MGGEKQSVIDFLSEDQEIVQIKQVLSKHNEVAIYGLGDGQRTLVTATLLEDQQAEGLLVICGTQKRAKELWEDLGQLMGKYEALYFPALEMIPFEVLAQSGEIEQQRLEVLAKLIIDGYEKKFIIVTTMEGFGKQLIDAAYFKQSILTVEVGEILPPEQLRKTLVSLGYEAVEQVQKKGQYSFRGGIVDVYPVYHEHPIRMEFFDDEIDSLRFFHVEDQRSIDRAAKAYITAAKEFFLIEENKPWGIAKIREEFAAQVEVLRAKKDRNPLERLQGRVGEVLEKVSQDMYFSGLEQYQSFFYPEGTTILSYFPQQCLVVLDESNRIQEAQEHLDREREQSFASLLLKGGVLPGQSSYFYALEELVEAIKAQPHICFSLMPKPSLFLDDPSMFTVDCKSIPPFFGKTQLLVDELKNWQRQKYGVLILLTSAAKALRLQQLLEDHDLTCSWIANRYQMDPGQIYMAYGNINQGAQFTQSKKVIITENEIFQQQKKRVNKKMFHEDGQRIVHLDDLKVGDYVVHINHGIGHYLGIERLKVGDIERDYLIIKYSGEDKLYVPVEQFDLLQKYVVNEGVSPKVNKLGGSEWQKAKMKAKASAEQVAEGLLEIYAKRKSQQGYAFSPDDHWQKEFEDAFPYVETDDQLKAIHDVKSDMMQSTVMDRLICGDVGYGKTEVAIRAAFKAVNDGKQVAVLVPTTVLAQQHYNTFEQRFSGYGIKVELLSRFRTAKDQKQVVQGVKDGSVDIVIGTHKLLNKEVNFRDLGLLVVDEEQRFGVTHKEKIKGLRSQVDVLTLSATPIPRTLHMSLVGIRDMSVIETPPQDRYPIQTYIVEHTPELLKDAIRRELGRGGQVYYVHNRIDDIDKVAEEVRLLVPEARVLVGHGQMKEQQMEQVMMEFINYEADVLVCTTIIETGLDISNANTLIVDEADKMGLSQLYQLRGRVGRSNRIAYAYLTYKKDKVLSELAEKRLSAIREYTELGSGFKVAMRDLEIRGAGNLLGAQQHGQVGAVGFDLYCKLLDDAIRELKGEIPKEEIQVEIDIQISSFIPDYYIKDASTKLGFYQRIQRTNSVNKLTLLEEELEDRFGDLPQETIHLLKVVELKIYCHQAKVSSIKQKAGIIYIGFAQQAQIEIKDLFTLASQKYKRTMSYGNTGGELMIKLTIGSMGQKECLDLVKDVVLSLTSIVQ